MDRKSFASVLDEAVGKLEGDVRVLKNPLQDADGKMVFASGWAHRRRLNKYDAFSREGDVLFEMLQCPATDNSKYLALLVGDDSVRDGIILTRKHGGRTLFPFALPNYSSLLSSFAINFNALNEFIK